MNDLSLCDAERVAALTARLRERIAAAGGWLPFAEFMSAALYEPGLGYYAQHARAFGAAGDFLTAPEISPLFGTVLADALAADVARCGRVVEFGAGSGQLAEDLLRRWVASGVPVTEYAIVEVSAGLAAQQRERLQPLAQALGVRIDWWSQLPTELAAVVLANEVLDVLPVHVVATEGEATLELGVTWDEAQQRFVWREAALTPAAAQALAGIELPRSDEGRYVTEVAPAVSAWVRTIAAALTSGAVLALIDYGYPRESYYAPFRSRGTLLGYYRHRVVEDVLAAPGACDITAFVDFTRVLEALEQERVAVREFATQGQFLLRHGVLERLLERAAPGTAAYVKAARALQRLIAPHEMGELFWVVVGVKT